jgi:hypothetical protein
MRYGGKGDYLVAVVLYLLTSPGTGMFLIQKLPAIVAESLKSAVIVPV